VRRPRLLHTHQCHGRMGLILPARPAAFVTSRTPHFCPLFNMLSQDLYPGKRQVDATAVKVEDVIATRDIPRMVSSEGHVAIRVLDAGRQFEILVVNNGDDGTG